MNRHKLCQKEFWRLAAEQDEVFFCWNQVDARQRVCSPCDGLTYYKFGSGVGGREDAPEQQGMQWETIHEGKWLLVGKNIRRGKGAG